MSLQKRPPRAAAARAGGAATGALLLLMPLVGFAKQHPRFEQAAGLPFARIPSGTYTPFYATDADRAGVVVQAFLLMTRPVTNAEFLAFVRSDPAWRRDRVAQVFADDGYLAYWATATELGAGAHAAQPVTRVSWFAAKAFCESRGLRLPTEAEWELAAAASELRSDGSAAPRYREQLLRWYSTPNTVLPDVPHGAANVYGVSDLHGVVWEWVLDFNSALALADSRGNDAGPYCGGGAVSAKDAADYPAFMRFALRSSLQASYATANLGFRCAEDLDGGKDQRP